MASGKFRIENNLGFINIADEVIYAIARQAVAETKGVAKSHERWGSELTARWGAKSYGIGAKVQAVEHAATIDIFAAIEMRFSVLKVGRDIQNHVKYRVENFTGINVLRVNVHFVSVYKSETNRD